VVFQPPWLSSDKRVSPFALFIHAEIHSLLTGLVVYVLLASHFMTTPFVWMVISVDGTSHFLIDSFKIYLERRYPEPVNLLRSGLSNNETITLIDQLLHFFVYVVLAGVLSS
jgi:hypothetical protein